MRRLFLSPFSILSMTGVMVVLGLGLMVAVDYAGRQFRPATHRAPESSITPVTQQTDNAGVPVSQVDSPVMADAAAAIPADAPDMFLAPENQAVVSTAAIPEPPSVETGKLYLPEKQRVVGLKQGRHNAVLQPEEKSDTVQQQTTGETPDTAPVDILSPATERSAPPREAQRLTETVALADPALVRQMATPLIGAKQASSGRHADSAVEDVESSRHQALAAYQKAAAQRRHIQKLVATIHDSLKVGDVATADVLIDQLSAIKGRSSEYVQKLRAYQAILSKDYQMARQLLESVLQDTPEDIEAGINMAIIDLRTGSIRAAKVRLQTLMALYPSDPQLMRIMEQIP
ncbi:MAG: tetratricopeptide repeat protein [Thermodesulfobacteriota bacterium]|nr:tetratricopeptide repeat protein [Thermodesulfobacteriota bacterium]